MNNESSNDLYIQVSYMQDNLVSFSTDWVWNEELYKYEELRRILINNELIWKMIPDYIVQKRDLKQFWQFIKRKFQHYSERREFLWDSFNPILSYLENTKSNPNHEKNNKDFAEFWEKYMELEWKKCIERLDSDPEWAITSSRTLLETTLKHILDKLNIEHSDDDLTWLYDKVAKNMNLSPSQHHEQIFKQILSWCKTVVFWIWSLRNKMSDAHGKWLKYVKPWKRHAELAVNLAWSLSSFLYKTYLENTK